MSEVIRQRRMQANYLNCSNDGKTKAFALLGAEQRHLTKTRLLRLRAVSMYATSQQQNLFQVTIGIQLLILIKFVSRTQLILLSTSEKISL